MAYVSANLNLLASGMGDGPSLWTYISTADVHGTVEGASFFSDGVAKGMKLGDLVDVVYTTGYLRSSHAVSVVTASTGACTISAYVVA